MCKEAGRSLCGAPDSAIGNNHQCKMTTHTYRKRFNLFRIGGSLWRSLLASLAFCAFAHTPAHAKLLWDPFFPGHNVITQLGDNDSIEVPIGFEVHTPEFFLFTKVFINANGNLTYDEAFSKAADNSLKHFKDGSYGRSVELEILAPFFIDLDLSTQGTITYGNPSANVFVASWVGVPFLDSTNLATFQVAIVREVAQFSATYRAVTNSAGATGVETTDVNGNSVIFSYGHIDEPPGPAAVGVAGSYGEYMLTLPFADADGFIAPGQIPQLVGPTDPYLFNSNRHFDDVVAFESLVLTATLSVRRQAANLIVSWPLPGTGLILQTTATPDKPASWAEVTLPYETSATEKFVTVPTGVGKSFYRLAEQ